VDIVLNEIEFYRSTVIFTGKNQNNFHKSHTPEVGKCSKIKKMLIVNNVPLFHIYTIHII